MCKYLITRNLKTFALFVLSVMYACQAYAQTCRIKGEIKGIGQTPVQFLYSQNGKEKRDTVYAVNDRFTYLVQPSDNGTFYIFIKNPRWIGAFYEAGELTVSGSIEKPYKLTITGGPENDAQTRYNQTIRWVYDEKRAGKSPQQIVVLLDEEKVKKMEFVKQHTATKVGAELLYSLTFDEDPDVTELEQVYSSLAPHIRTGGQGKEIAKRITIIKNQPVKGRKAPDFKLVSSASDSVSLAAYKGKYVLLDFWGHWCGPCIQAMPALRTIHDKYAGKLAIVGIAAEYGDDKGKWLEAIEKHQAKWTQLSEFKGDDGAVNIAYNIIQFPTYFLLDKEGVVLGKANDVATIEGLLATLRDL